MQRDSIQNMQRWYGAIRRKPLVLRGARQVGKSTLVRQFASSQGLDLLEVNLERHRDLDVVFSKLQLEEIFANLEAISGKQIGKNTLLFLDEIQSTPHALAALRYFYEDRAKLAVVAAGSLLEFTLSDHSFSMPVGRIQYLHLGPMSFSEYLDAIDPAARHLLKQISPEKQTPQKLHEKLSRHQRHYMLVGGMPEAVDTFRLSTSMIEVATIQDAICDTYSDDFAKYARQKDLANLQKLFRTLPATIGEKLKYVNLLPEQKSAYVRGMVELLVKARVASIVTKSDCSGVPLGAGVNSKFLKLLSLDVGLVCCMLGTDWIDLKNRSAFQLINKGALAEQFIGQHLRDSYAYSQSGLGHNSLYYWLRESRSSNAEIDFVIQRGELIVPVEVKAGASGTLRSLHQFMFEKGLNHAIRFDTNPASSQCVTTMANGKSGHQPVSYTLHSLPLYAVGCLPQLLDKIRQQL